MTTYESMAARYRPSKLSDLIGQETAVKTIRGMLRSKKISRVILCSGPHGLGKTTLARLIAMSINCKTKTDDGACGECDSCTSILRADQNTSVHEINGADSRKIEDAREIIQIAKYVPRGAKYRVFILDEVHQLTPEAFKSLLKILEEPPPQTVFILCTTDPTKIPPEIKSRTISASMVVRPIQPEDMARYLKRIAKAEGKPISGEVAMKLATASRGHIRDALNLMESFMLVLAGSDEEPDLNVLMDELLGDASDTLASTFVLSVASGETQKALALLRKVFNHQVFCESVTRLSMHAVLQTVGERNHQFSDFYDEIGGITSFDTIKAVKQLDIWNEAAAKVKLFQTNDPYAVMVSATVRASEVK